MSRPVKLLACLVFLSCLLQPVSAIADQEAFLCIPDVTGGSSDSRNEGCSDVRSWQMDMGQSGSFHMGTGYSAGAVNISPLVVVKPVDVASVPLMAKLVSGTHYSHLLLRVFEACSACELPESPILVYRLENVIVTKLESGDVEGSAELTELVELSFAIIRVCYSEAGIEGEPFPCDDSFEWNLSSNSSA